MKNTFCILTFILLFFQISLMAQENQEKTRNDKFGISFSSFGENDVVRFDELEGAASYSGDYFFTVGINYVHPLNRWLDAETGLEYSEQHILIHPNLSPDIPSVQRRANFSLLNVPVSLRANFLNYFFVNGGLLLEVDASANSPIDNQTGIGTILGLAFQYEFKNGVSVFVNPYSKIHALIPFASSNYPQRVFESGFRFGIMYDFPKFER